MDIIDVLFVCILFVLVLIIGFSSNSDSGYSKYDKKINIFKWWIRLTLFITLGVLGVMKFTECKRRNDFNSRAKICMLGLHESPDRVSIVLDSLCKHNRVKFGEVITNEYALSKIYRDKNLPNLYTIGCQDTITGDRLEIQFIILEQDTYDGEGWMPRYFTNIKRISLRNEKGIQMSNVNIASDFLPGGSGFNQGYCAMISDTCATLYTRQ